MINTKLTMWTVWLQLILHLFQKGKKRAHVTDNAFKLVLKYDCRINKKGRAHCAYVNKTDMSWAEGFSKCQLANKADVDRHIEHYRAWVGALSVYTPWMVHEGCFIKAKSVDQERRIFYDNSPSRCSYHCRTYQYFALMGTMCRCADKTHLYPKTHPNRCDSPCSASRQDKCGSSDQKYVNLFSHKTGKHKPRDDFFRLTFGNESVCSVVVVVNNAFHVEADHCWKKHNFLCERTERGLSDKETYNSANKICHLTGEVDSDIISKLKLNRGKYWTGIHRVHMIRWLEQETLQDLCNEFGSLEKMKCILVQYKSATRILKTPATCTEWYPVLCSSDKVSAGTNSDTFTVCNKGEISINQTKMTSIQENDYSTEGKVLTSHRMTVRMTSITATVTTKASIPTTLKMLTSTTSATTELELDNIGSTEIQAFPTTELRSTNAFETTESKSIKTTDMHKYPNTVIVSTQSIESIAWTTKTTTEREIQSTNAISTTNVSVPALNERGGSGSYHLFFIIGVISVAVICVIVISVVSLVCYSRNKTYQVTNLDSKVKKKQKCPPVQQTAQAATYKKNISITENLFVNDKCHPYDEIDYHDVQFNREKEEVGIFVSGLYDTSQLANLQSNQVASYMQNKIIINTEKPFVLDKHNARSEYDHLKFTREHENVSRFVGGPIYDTSDTRNMCQNDKHLNPVHLTNLIGNDIKATGGQTSGKSSKSTFCPKETAFHCQTEINHSQFVYDVPSAVMSDK